VIVFISVLWRAALLVVVGSAAFTWALIADGSGEGKLFPFLAAGVVYLALDAFLTYLTCIWWADRQ
jgi:hypothetical protein